MVYRPSCVRGVGGGAAILLSGFLVVELSALVVFPGVQPRVGLSRGGASRPSMMSAAKAPDMVALEGETPIVWTIAGSDSGGGAGIQADLHAMHALDTHGCSVITAMTAQNSRAVTHVEYASVEMIRATIAALESDLPPAAVKLGMMGTDAVVSVVGEFLGSYKGKVVCDPVMISTSCELLYMRHGGVDADLREFGRRVEALSNQTDFCCGSRLMAEGTEARMVECIFPRATMITPNLIEAEALTGRKLRTPADVEAGGAQLLASSGAGGVLIKGGHAESADTAGGKGQESAGCVQDYWTDGTQEGSFWLTASRVDSDNTHGTGCTLSSAAAACLARGLDAADAIVIAKAYVTQGIHAATRLGQGPGPVAHTGWPAKSDCFPWVTATAEAGASERPKAFPRCHDDWGLYPVVESSDWVEKLISLGVRDIQLRVKGASPEALDAQVGQAAEACRAAGGRLWVNDFWQSAVKHGAYGVHLGQEDLEAGGGEALRAISAAGLRLGVSTHSYLELARATAVRPSYISLGPVFETRSKKVAFSPRGTVLVKAWRALVDVPLIAIGGITLETAPKVLEAGADSIAVISAITNADDAGEAVRQWSALFMAKGIS